MIRLNIICAVLIVIILCIRKVFYNKISRNLQYVLWISIPLYVFLFPVVKIELPVYTNTDSLLTFEDYEKERGGNDRSNDSGVIKKRIVEDTALKETQEINPQGGVALRDIHKNNILTMLFSIINYIVMATMLFYILAKNMFCYYSCLKKRKFYKYDNERRMKVYVLKDIKSPFLLGKSIYVDAEMVHEKNYLKYMLLHEYCHWKHGDIFWKIINIGFIIYFWYNPFFWIASYYVNRDCELACDEKAIQMIGADQTQQYGETLLYLARRSLKNNNSIIMLSMGGKISMLNERINCLITDKKYKKNISIFIIIVLCLIFSLLFVYFTPKRMQAVNANSDLLNENTAVDEKAGDFAESEKELYNNYYNLIKTDGTNIYYATKEGIIRRDIKTTQKTVIATGDYILGDISDGYLYYTKYEETVSVGRIELNTLITENVGSLEYNNERSFSAPCISQNGKIYVEENIGEIRKIYCFSFDENKNDWNQESNDGFAKNIKEITDGDVTRLRMDCVNAISSEKVLLVEEDNNVLKIYSDNYDLLHTINDYMGNAMLVDNGIVYYDTNNNIHLCTLDSLNDKVLYQYKNDNFLNYGTYNKYGIYGIYNKNKDEQFIVKLSWDGTITELYKISSDRDISMLSVLKNNLLFFEKNELVSIEIKD